MLKIAGKLLLAGVVIALLFSGWGMFLLAQKEKASLLSRGDFQRVSDIPAAAPGVPAAAPAPASVEEVMRATAAMRQQHFQNSPDNLSRVTDIRPSLTIGPDTGDLKGADDKVIQAGIDYLARMGGGTLQILPGTYAIHNAITLHSNVNIKGNGPDTILRKAKGVSVPLAQDADWFETAVVVADAAGFSPGNGVMIQARKPGTEGMAGLTVTKAVITHIAGNIVSLDRHLEKEYRAGNNPRLTSSFPLLTGEKLADIRLERLVLDGNKDENEFIDGNLAGAIFLKFCDRVTFSEVVAQNYNGDGFSVQACNDLRFERCTARDNAKFGFHPGSGSKNTILNQVVSSGNAEGIFFCWGVNNTIVYQSNCSRNRDYGISIGYRDTDNVIQGCTFENNGKTGILFREAKNDFEGAHRNVVTSCVIKDNGALNAEGIGIDIREFNHDLVITENDLVNSTEGHQTSGIRVFPEALRVNLQGNRFDGPQTSLDASKPLKETIKTLIGR